MPHTEETKYTSDNMRTCPTGPTGPQGPNAEDGFHDVIWSNDPLRALGILSGFEFRIPFTVENYVADTIVLPVPIGGTARTYRLFLNALTGIVIIGNDGTDFVLDYVEPTAVPPNHWDLATVTIPAAQTGIDRFPQISAVKECVLSGMDIVPPLGAGELSPITGINLDIDVTVGTYKRNSKSIEIDSGRYRLWEEPVQKGWDAFEEDKDKVADTVAIPGDDQDIFVHISRDTGVYLTSIDSVTGDEEFYTIVLVSIEAGALMLKQEYLRDERSFEHDATCFVYIQEIQEAVNYRRVQVLKIKEIGFEVEGQTITTGPQGPQQVIGLDNFGQPILGPFGEPEDIVKGGSNMTVDLWDRPRKAILKIMPYFGYGNVSEILKDFEGNPRGFHDDVLELRGGVGVWSYHVINDYRRLLDAMVKIQITGEEDPLVGINESRSWPSDPIVNILIQDTPLNEELYQLSNVTIRLFVPPKNSNYDPAAPQPPLERPIPPLNAASSVNVIENGGIAFKAHTESGGYSEFSLDFTAGAPHFVTKDSEYKLDLQLNIISDYILPTVLEAINIPIRERPGYPSYLPGQIALEIPVSGPLGSKKLLYIFRDFLPVGYKVTGSGQPASELHSALFGANDWQRLGHLTRLQPFFSGDPAVIDSAGIKIIEVGSLRAADNFKINLFDEISKRLGSVPEGTSVSGNYKLWIAGAGRGVNVYRSCFVPGVGYLCTAVDGGFKSEIEGVIKAISVTKTSNVPVIFD